MPLFDDIEGKVDLYLTAVNKDKGQDKSQGQGSDADGNESSAMALQSLCDEAKDYLKMLHSIVSGL